jgi:hypothetical protein
MYMHINPQDRSSSSKKEEKDLALKAMRVLFIQERRKEGLGSQSHAQMQIYKDPVNP